MADYSKKVSERYTDSELMERIFIYCLLDGMGKGFSENEIMRRTNIIFNEIKSGAWDWQTEGA